MFLRGTIKVQQMNSGGEEDGDSRKRMEWIKRESSCILKKKQLTIKKYIEEKLNDDEELVESIKGFRNEIKELLKTFNTNVTKSIAGRSEG